MKRIITLIALALAMLSSSAFATDLASSGVSGAGVQISGNKTGGGSSVIGSLSSNVKITVNYDATSFAAATKHLNGTKGYGSSAGDTKIYSMEIAAGTDISNNDLQNSASDSSAFQGGSWSSL